MSYLAKAMATKAFPNSGIFHAAGWAPGEAINPALGRIASKLDLDIEGSRCASLASSPKFCSTTSS